MTRFLIRLIGLILLGFGTLGCVGAFVGHQLLAIQLQDLRDSPWIQTASSRGTTPLQSVLSVLRSTATATGSAEGSLAAAQQSLRTAGSAAAQLGLSMRALASAMDLDLPGGRPFAEVTDPLMQSASRLGDLSSALESTVETLGRSRVDLARVEQDLVRLHTQLDPMANADAAGGALKVVGALDTTGSVVLAALGLQSGLFGLVGLALLLVPVRRIS